MRICSYTQSAYFNAYPILSIAQILCVACFACSNFLCLTVLQNLLNNLSPPIFSSVFSLYTFAFNALRNIFNFNLLILLSISLLCSLLSSFVPIFVLSVCNVSLFNFLYSCETYIAESSPLFSNCPALHLLLVSINKCSSMCSSKTQ